MFVHVKSFSSLPSLAYYPNFLIAFCNFLTLFYNVNDGPLIQQGTVTVSFMFILMVVTEFDVNIPLKMLFLNYIFSGSNTSRQKQNDCTSQLASSRGHT